ncbi:uncharacterized protein LOC126629346 [Malus sylvestris]|uniref:uncharacterized protein LOC126629346 n=1 Tax=Malus sylvestris TaxID=3752 RepID=UPI0021AC84B6|nr:uncharacterized protein LOC126629346 [Malus sylvestris]
MAKRELSSTLRNLKVYAKSNLERGEERRRCQTIPHHLSYISTFPLMAFDDWISRVYFPCFDHFIWQRVLGFGEFFIKLAEFFVIKFLGLVADLEVVVSSKRLKISTFTKFISNSRFYGQSRQEDAFWSILKQNGAWNACHIFGPKWMDEFEN